MWTTPTANLEILAAPDVYKRQIFPLLFENVANIFVCRNYYSYFVFVCQINVVSYA